MASTGEYEHFDSAVFLGKLQATEGAAETGLTGASNAIRLVNGKSKIDRQFATIVRDSQNSGNNRANPGSKSFSLDAEIELIGAAPAGTRPNIDPILQVCGHASVVTASTKVEWNPITNGIKALTGWFKRGSREVKAYDVKGGLGALSFKMNDFAKATFSAKGRVDADADEVADYAGVDWSAVQDPLAIITDTFLLQLSGVNMDCTEFGVQFGRTANVHVNSEAQKVNNKKHAATFSATFIRPKYSVFNPNALADAGSEITLLSSVTGVATRNFSVLATKAQILQVEEADVDGFFGWTVTGQLNKFNAGANEYLMRAD
jgi:hypothetical protein